MSFKVGFLSNIFDILGVKYKNYINSNFLLKCL